MLDEDGETTILELTQRVRAATVARHVSTLPTRLREPLDELLAEFVVANPLGILLGFAHLASEITLPPLDPEIANIDSFAVFAWGSVYVAMLRRAMELDTGGCSHDTGAALDAAADRMSLFAYEPWPDGANADDALPARLDQIAWAYAVGAAIGWLGVAEGAPADVQRVRQAIGALKPEECLMLEQRYRDGLSQSGICAQHDHGGGAAAEHFARLLRALDPPRAARDRRTSRARGGAG